ncbi:GNAT family N-acetyltransferase [Frigoribacterium sp. CFBP 13712]|uniref:GNAT family N-acetyltransferase n=1 Tax=Frigoribacterium sp. CFBP 13712 TaxID=2775309 RepID=UPI0018D5DCB9|nr:GNAT family N-acetyltransferase [Frigoribacterium sp. CFBP 13712]
MMVTLITLSSDDWRVWRSLRLAALAEAPEAFGSRSADWVDADEGRWRERLSIPGAIDLVALDEGTGCPIGMVTGTPSARPGAGAELISLWVDPAARGRGVATLLIDAVATWAAAAGASRLELSVMAENESARRTYERNGFAVAAGSEVELKMTRAL